MEDHPHSPVRQLARALLVDVYGMTRPAGSRPGPAELRRAARTAVRCLDHAARSPTALERGDAAEIDEARAALREVALLTRRCRRQGILAERPARTLLARQAAAAAALDAWLRADRQPEASTGP